MPTLSTINLSVKNVPEALATKLRARAERNHRSLQGELMVILEEAVSAPATLRSGATVATYGTGAVAPATSLLERLDAIARGRGIDTTKRLTREQAHDRKLLRKLGI